MKSDSIVIIGAARTPIGNFLGELKDVRTSELGAAAIKAAIERAQLQPQQIDEILMGCVLPAALGQAPARQASIGAGIPPAVPATTINKVCGSGLKTVMIAHDQLLAGNGNIIVAGGMESMSNAPYLMPKARTGYRMGHQTVLDHMFYDGLEDAYDKGKLMGCFAELCAQHYHFSREAQDQYVISSLHRAQAAIADGTFNHEITPVILKTAKGEVVIDTDEGPRTATSDKIPTLKPVFAKGGTVTAANSSSISDGAAAVIVARASAVKQKSLATIVAHATYAQDPAWFTTAPVGAIKKVCEKAGWYINEVDLFEINEAFAVVVLAAMKELNLPPEKVNVHGGGTVLGHPIGASGARVLVTLIYALHKYKKRRGIATLCLGGGEAVAVAIEVV